MGNIVLLFIRYGGFLLFLLLEGVCFYFIVQFNDTQKVVYVNSMNNVTTALDAKVNQLNTYLHLEAMSDSLAVENARLRALLLTSRYNFENQVDTIVREDSSLANFTYIPAEVVSNSVVKKRNMIIINRGSLQGVKSGMGAISPTGIVGVVRSVEPHYASIMSLLHTQIKISASIEPTKFHGSLVWDGRNPREMLLENVPKHAEFKLLDTISTSGYSSVFPKGIPIGVVSRKDMQPGSNFHRIWVKLFADLSNLQYVYIVKSQFKSEIDSLVIDQEYE